MTHQDIINRKRAAYMRTVDAEEALKESSKIEQESFEKECASIGHLIDSVPLWSSCVVCGAILFKS